MPSEDTEGKEAAKDTAVPKTQSGLMSKQSIRSK
jgi:hypothetical protein